MTALDEWLCSAVVAGERRTVLHANAHGVNLAQHDAALRTAYRAADLVYCDGVGVMLAAWLEGARVPQRITGADWLWHLHDLAVQNRWRLFLVGGARDVAARAAAALGQRSGCSAVVGVHDGYFNKTGPENDQVLQQIRSSAPDIVLVGLGMPLQEHWINTYRDTIDAAVVISQGGAFKYVAGDVRRGPPWMTDHGLEWLARLAIEPRRLALRYILGIPQFVCRVVLAHVTGNRRAN
jgi:N-acetylglucosaminyldiphosphoundecaprenol N-acetyl-beta-D-mannosaminyltransferase